MRRNIQLGLIIGLLSIALPIGFLLTQPDRQDGSVPPNQAHQWNAGERNTKAAILSNDVAMTEALCRKQCRRDLGKLSKEIANANRKQIQLQLQRMRVEHPHMHVIEWIPPSYAAGRSDFRSGDLDASIRKQAQAYWREAVRSVSKGIHYESKAIRAPDGNLFFVMGVPSQNRTSGGSLVGLVHQDLLQHVAEHQARNLRLKEYPDEDKRFGIRAVDPDTGLETDVDSPEENEGISHYLKREVVVRFQNEPRTDDMETIKKHVDASSVKKLGNAYVFESQSKSTKDMLDYFSTLDIEYAEPHYIYVTNETEIVPNDELYAPYQWNLPAVETPEGWTYSRGSQEVIVAVVDTGVSSTHPDLKNKLTEGYNVVNPDRQPDDDVGHGTHVAGVISALTDNGQGIAGMTWLNKIMPVKVLDSSGMGSTYAVAEGIIWATDHGARVINLSLGNYASAAFLHDAIRYAYDRDVVLIAATGNDNTDQPGYPAAYPEVFAVSATNMNRHRASFSNYGDYVDVVAPGENIASTYIHNQYAALSGTSMASPHVSALAALIRSVNPSLTNKEVYEVMRKSASDLGAPGRDSDFGYGQINVANALKAVAGEENPAAAADKASETQTVEPSDSWLARLIRKWFG